MKALKHANKLISINLPPDILKKLDKVSKFEERPKIYYIKKGLSELLEQKYNDIEDYLNARKTMESVKSNGEKLVSFDTVFKNVK